MNKVYQVVWNRTKRVWQAASELTQARSGGASSGRICSIQGAVAGTLFLFALPLHAADLPSGGQVVGGQGSINSSGNTLTVNQTSQNVAVNWNDFSVAEGHTVNFVQPNAQAAALNRVTGNNVSDIRGAINANGRVFLVNPNGVMFSSTARVDVGSLVASTLDISTEGFMAGNYQFQGASANAIINQGNIATAEGGVVAMIATRIINTGNITTPSGSTLMGAGSSVTLDLGGPVKIEVEEALLEAYIEQGGAIRADGGLVYLTAKAANELTASVINHTGISEARTLAADQRGRIMLMGDMNSGQVQVAGTLDASASSTGDGGFIETSAAHVQVNDVQVTTYADQGETGTWLIDPVDITIAASGGNVTGAAIASALETSNVTLDTSASGTCAGVTCSGLSSGNGDIWVNDDIQVTGGNTDTTLTFKADRSIIMKADKEISSTSGKLNVVFWARSAGNLDASDGQLGSVWLMADSSVITNGGNITIGGGTDPLAGYALGDTRTSAEGNAIVRGSSINGSLDAGGGDIRIRGRGRFGAWARGVSIGGDIRTEGAGTISIYGVASNGSDAIAVGDSALTDKSGSISAGTGTVYLEGQRDSGKSINVNNGSSITGSGQVVLNGLNGEISSGSSDFITADKLLILNASKATLNSIQNDINTLAASGIGSGGLSVTDKDDITIGAVDWNSASYMGVDATGSINIATLSGNLDVNESISTNSNATNAITLNAGRDESAGTASGGDIRITGASITTGAAGRALLYTGSLVGSSGLTDLIGFGSARFRYNSDESATGYSSPLSNGLYAIYREQPTLLVGVEAESMIYGDALPGYTAVYSGFANGDTASTVSGSASWATATGTVSNSGKRVVGSYDVSYSSGLTSGLGYALADNVASVSELTIEKRVLSLDLTGTSSRVYDGSTDIGFTGYTANVIGGISGDDLVIDTGNLTGFVDKNVGDNKRVTFTGFDLSGTDVSNYEFSSVSAQSNASITRKAITVSGITAEGRVYDGTTDATVNSTGASGWIAGDDVQVSASGQFTDKNAGVDKTVNLTSSYSGDDAGNYLITDQNSTTASITPRRVTVAADSAEKDHGTDDPFLTYQTSCGVLTADCGMIQGESLAGVLGRDAGEGPGNYVIGQGTLDESANPNYAIEFEEGELVIAAMQSSGKQVDAVIASIQQQTGSFGLRGNVEPSGGLEIIDMDEAPTQQASNDDFGPLRLFVIDGGIRLTSDSTSPNQN